MSYLITEIALLLAGTALIAWIGGRFVCKRGEKELRIKTNQLSGKHAALTDRHGKLEVDFDRLKKKTHQLEEEHASLSEVKATISKQLDEVVVERDDQAARIQRLESYRNDLQKTQDELDDLRMQLVDERSGHDGALQKAAFLEQENKEIMERLNALTNQSDTLHMKLGKLNNQSVDYKDRLQTAMETHTEMSDQIRELSRERDELNAKISNLQKTQEDGAAQLTAVEKIENTLAEEELLRLKAEIRAIEDERDSYETRLSRLLQERTTVVEPVKDANRWDAVSLRTEIESLKSDYRALQVQYDEVVMQKNDYLGRLRAISSVVESLNAAKAVAESDPDSTQDKMTLHTKRL